MYEVELTFRLGFSRTEFLDRNKYPYLSQKERTLRYSKDALLFTKTIQTDKPLLELNGVSKELDTHLISLFDSIDAQKAILAGEQLVASSLRT